MVNTGLLPDGKFPQPFLPEYNLSGFAGRSVSLLLQFSVCTRHALQGPVVRTGLTVVVVSASLVTHHPGLRPDTRGVIFGGFCIYSRDFHFN